MFIFATMNKILSLIFISFLCASCLDSIEEQVVQDSLESYQMALASGDKLEINLEAAMVAEAYKQAGDQENYIKWLDIAKKAEKDYMDESMSELNEDY
jgi:hypothetical protein